MPGTEQVAQGRLAGAKAQSYLRAVNEPEARASQFTARLMLITVRPANAGCWSSIRPSGKRWPRSWGTIRSS
jgi:hypothetical protein